MNIPKLVEEFKTKHGREPQPWEISTHQNKCGNNRCPLYFNHPDYLKWEVMPSDPNKKCSMNKTDRKRVGKFFKLKNLGLTERELSYHNRWADLPESVKQERIAKLKKNSPFIRLKQKGYGIVPLKRGNFSDTLQTGSKNATATPGERVKGVQMILSEVGK